MANAFQRGAQMALQMFQMKNQMMGQKTRSKYMDALMQNMAFQQEQAIKKTQTELKKQKALQTIFSSMEEETPGGEIGQVVGPGEKMLTQHYGPEVAQALAPLLAQGAIGMPDIPTGLEYYGAETKRLAATKGKQAELPTTEFRLFMQQNPGATMQDWLDYLAKKRGATAPRPTAPSLPAKQQAVVREINEILQRYGAKIDFIALAAMDKQQRTQYLKQQQIDLMKRVKEPQRKRLRQLYKKLEQITETIVGPLPEVAEEKILTPDVAADFLAQANGDKEKARQLAIEAGYRW